jgi:hypothetical protein
LTCLRHEIFSEGRAIVLAGLMIVNAGVDLSGGPGEVGFNMIGDAQQQIAASAARLGQAFAGRAQNFPAPNTARNLHAKHRAGNSTTHFPAALNGALGIYFQIAA